jgi:hypothetical protein
MQSQVLTCNLRVFVRRCACELQMIGMCLVKQSQDSPEATQLSWSKTELSTHSIALSCSLAVTQGGLSCFNRTKTECGFYGYVHRSCALLLAKALGPQVLAGHVRPSLLERSGVCTVPVCWLCLVLLTSRIVFLWLLRVSELAFLHC